MHIVGFEHVNLRTARMSAMIDWYGEILDMTPGPRPAFTNSGAWLYLGDQPLVHLVEVSEPPEQGDNLALEHFALKGADLAGFREKLRANGIAFEETQVPGLPILQVNIWDPDRNHIHIDFEHHA